LPGRDDLLGNGHACRWRRSAGGQGKFRIQLALAHGPEAPSATLYKGLRALLSHELRDTLGVKE
jgi:hypothetical protein